MLLLALTIILGVPTTSCGDLSPTLVIGSVSQDAGPIVVRPDPPDLGDAPDAAPPSSADAGFAPAARVDLVLASVDRVPPTAPPGAQVELRFVAENLGRNPSPPSYARVSVSSDASMHEDSVEAGTAALPSLAPGASLDLSVEMQVPPDLDPGRYRATVTLDPENLIDELLESNNALNAGAIDVTTLEVTPLVLDFGAVGPGCASTRSVRARHLGPGRAVVAQAELDPEPSFRLSPPSLPQSLGAGEELPLALTFAPLSTGPALTELRLMHDRFVGPQSVLVVGEGQLSPRREDESLQGQPQIDLLFVVQNGCALSGCPLADEQLELASALPVFLQAAAGIGADWRILVTTTDPADHGQLRGPPLTARTAQLQTSFQNQVEAGTSGSTVTAGLAAAGAVLEAGLARADASVVIIVVALDDDRSGGTPGEWVDRLRESFDRRGEERLLLHGVVPPPPGGCPGEAGAATRYAAASALTGGALSSICDLDDYDVLFRLGGAGFGLQDRFALSREPISPETISVEVDGRPVDSFDPVSGARRWRFEASTRTVFFQGTALPAAGSQVRIRYRSAC